MILVALGLGTKRHWHIFIAIFLGVVLGYFLPLNPEAPSFAHKLFQLLGSLFINLVGMIAIPLIISSLLIGITSLGDGRQLGKLGIKTIVFFGALMVLSGTVAAALGVLIKPGLYFPQDILNFISQPLVKPIETAHYSSFADLILGLVPQNLFESLSKRELVPVIAFTLIFGAAMSMIGDTARPFIAFFEAVFAATMRIVDWIMIFAVPGVFALTFTVISELLGKNANIDLFRVLGMLLPYIGTVLAALFVQILIVYPVLLSVMARVNFTQLYRAISEAILVAFGTASSSATLPVTLACMERRAGVSNRIASFVLPAGVSMNMNGTTAFEVIAVIFLAQLYGIPLTISTLVTIVLLAIVASVGAAGVPAAGMITMPLILNGIGGFTPQQVAQGIALIWVVDRILDMCRTTVNVMDDCVVATIIGASEGELNRDVLRSGESWEDVV